MSCILVVGCYRSGTSAVAGVLHHLGVMMGTQFDEPTRNNVKGYWEDLEFKRLHKSMSNGDNSEGLYQNLIRRRELEYKIWGLKDPLLCFHLPKFISYLTSEHKVIVCRRSLEEITASMGRAINNNADDKTFTPLAEHYLNHMNMNLNEYKGPVLELNHGATLNDPKATVEKISDFVGQPVTDAALNHIGSRDVSN